VKGFFSKTDVDLLNLQIARRRRYDCPQEESKERPVGSSALHILQKLFPGVERFDKDAPRIGSQFVLCEEEFFIQKGVHGKEFNPHFDVDVYDLPNENEHKYSIIVHLGKHPQMSTGFANVPHDECGNTNWTNMYFDNDMNLGDFTIHDEVTVCHAEPYIKDLERKIMIMSLTVHPSMTLDVILNGIRKTLR
jgi:hypothetical protein